MTTKTIVITGVSRGLGLALVEEFIAAGHSVHGCSRGPEAVVALSQKHSAPHSFRSVDVADAAAVSQWAEELRQSGAVPDLLINNAALINQLAPLWEVPAAEFSALTSVNLDGVANCVREFVPAMIDRGRGVIVNLSSGWGRSTSPQVAPYCATKWGIEGLTSALAQELPPGLAALAISPGTVDTDMLRIAFGASAGSSPSPEAWAQSAAPGLLALTAADNGRSITL
ncbi:MAG: SDR family oxidoreductase [Planctomycetota bacterium]